MIKKDCAGFTLLESMISLWIVSIVLVIVLPDFVASFDRAQLRLTTQQVVSQLCLQQMKAIQWQRYEEVRFEPYGLYYQLYDPILGIGPRLPFTGRTEYFEGYLHLPLTTIRYDARGFVNQSGQAAFVSPEGDIQNIVIYLQYGGLRLLPHMITGALPSGT